jgi:hypothetical protein
MEFRRPGDEVRALDSEAGENIVMQCLVCRCGGQKQPVEVQHTQEGAELTTGLGRLAVLKMGYSSCQRLETLSRHLVTEEGDLEC